MQHRARLLTGAACARSVTTASSRGRASPAYGGRRHSFTQPSSPALRRRNTTNGCRVRGLAPQGRRAGAVRCNVACFSVPRVRLWRDTGAKCPLTRRDSHKRATAAAANRAGPAMQPCLASSALPPTNSSALTGLCVKKRATASARAKAQSAPHVHRATAAHARVVCECFERGRGLQAAQQALHRPRHARVVAAAVVRAAAGHATATRLRSAQAGGNVRMRSGERWASAA
jgi:hypothetical protein